MYDLHIRHGVFGMYDLHVSYVWSSDTPF